MNLSPTSFPEEIFSRKGASRLQVSMERRQAGLCSHLQLMERDKPLWRQERCPGVTKWWKPSLPSQYILLLLHCSTRRLLPELACLTGTQRVCPGASLIVLCVSSLSSSRCTACFYLTRNVIQLFIYGTVVAGQQDRLAISLFGTQRKGEVDVVDGRVQLPPLG